MNNTELIKGIEQVIEGLNLIHTAILKNSGYDVKEAPFNFSEVEDEVEVAREDLNSMGYNEFKKYAASLGVKCTGTREQIMERVLKALGEVEEETEEEVEEDSKSSEPDTSEEDSDEETTGEDDDWDEFDKQARAIAEETDVEDIIEALKDSGVKANKNNYLEKLAHALRKGLIELEDDEESEEDSTEDDVEEDDDVVNSTSYFAEYDPDGLNDPDEMSEERAEAVEKKMSEILKWIEKGKLSAKDVSEYVDDFSTDKEKALLPKKPTEGDLLKMYMELVKRTIDNEGEEHEPSEPYELGEENFCCGHVLKYSKSTKKYICEICGEEYEADE